MMKGTITFLLQGRGLEPKAGFVCLLSLGWLARPKPERSAADRQGPYGLCADIWGVPPGVGGGCGWGLVAESYLPH